MRLSFAAFCFGFFGLVHSGSAQRVDLAWPTPNAAYFEGKPISAFIQPTASGVPESGLFGCQRSNGGQFHEGIDLKPISRDQHGEPADSVFAAMAGVVRHIASNPSESNYGRYIVVEHPGTVPAVLTLYAHLSSIAPGLKVGDSVQKAQTIGTMGRSESGLAIPKERAHLHFEMDLQLTENFQTWYDFRRFGSRNDHGIWNGMNLVGFDPLDFFNRFRAHTVGTFAQYLKGLNAAVKVRVATHFIPDFIQRYPALLTKPMPPANQFAGWEVIFDEVGIPFAWTPLSATETMDLTANEPRAEPVNPAAKLTHCKSLLLRKRGRYAIGRDLEMNLQLLFGWRKPL